MGENKYKKEATTYKSVNISSDTSVDPNFERMIKYFIKQTQKDGNLEELKRRKYYTKSSDLKRVLENERRRKNKTRKNQKRRKHK